MIDNDRILGLFLINDMQATPPLPSFRKSSQIGFLSQIVTQANEKSIFRFLVFDKI